MNATKYLVGTSELFKTDGVKVQIACVDGITSQSSSHEEGTEFVQNPNTSSANGQTNEIVKTIIIFTADVNNPDRKR